MTKFDTDPTRCGFDCYASMPAATPCSSSDESLPPTVIAVNSVTGIFSNIEHKYHINQERVIGTGYTSSVSDCMNRTTGQRFAVKSIRKSNPAVNMSDLHREVKLLEEMNHNSVVRLVDVYEDAEFLHLVTDLYSGGELFDKMAQKKKASVVGCFAEDESARILHEVLTAISYLHTHDIVHRDIKPENILFESTKEDSPIKIIDFGLARKHSQNSFEPYMSDIVGTSYFLAPEVLRQKYTKSCDLWAVGVTAYLLISGDSPFSGKTNKDMFDAIKRGKFNFQSIHWKGASKEAKDFISRLLRVNPRKRMTVDQALNHPWIAKHVFVTSELFDSPCVDGVPKMEEDPRVVSKISKRKESILPFGGISRTVTGEYLELSPFRARLSGGRTTQKLLKRFAARCA